LGGVDAGVCFDDVALEEEEICCEDCRRENHGEERRGTVRKEK
jgi:hypothetical protein